jgi:ComEC/Rec2-related protein
VYLGNLLLFLLFIFLSLGILLFYQLSNFFLFVILAGLSCCLSYFSFRKGKILYSDLTLALFFIFLGACLYGSSVSNDLNLFLGRRQVSLKVISLPRGGKLNNSFTARLKVIDNTKIFSTIRVLDYSKKMQYGDICRSIGKISKSQYQGRKFHILRIKKNAPIAQMPSEIFDKVKLKAVNATLGIFKKHCSQQSYCFLGSVLMGRRELLKSERKMFANCGLSHLLAISGLHIGLISYVLFFILRLFNISFRKRLVLLFFFFCFYAFVTGMSPPTVRAVSMYCIFVLSIFTKRRLNPLNVLGLSGFLIILIDPNSLFKVGFQLSFLAVFSIILGFRYIGVSHIRNRVLIYIKCLLLCSLFVTIFLTPLVSYYFGKIHLFSILYNVILIPFFTVIITFAIILIILSPLSIIAESLGFVISCLVDIFIKIISIFASWELSFLNYRFSLFQIYCYYIFLSLALIVIFYKNNSKPAPRVLKSL